MINNLTPRIRFHYNLLAPFYYSLWGQHIHHGFWESEQDSTPQAQAQEHLIEQLYTFAGRPPVAKMVDVGCGYAGSLLWFARQQGASGLGITISPIQRLIGRLKVLVSGAGKKVKLKVTDAQKTWPIVNQSLDLVWCVECSEHLADKLHFTSEAYRVLKPGGTICLAAWLAGEVVTPEAVALKQTVEKGMLCYPFGSAKEYQAWLEAAGFEGVQVRIVTPNVLRTWQLCLALSKQPVLAFLSARLGGDVAAFSQSFEPLLRAYQTGAMDYGFFVAHKSG